ncbi:MAG: DUF2029 domain-containing protein [Candidatus Lokiarchaeota archaeon]|nr:DUF2029 domain-containing protein [Candidatus Lokiarchaeota archaeon]
MHEPVTAKGLRQFKIAFHASLLASLVLGMLWWLHEDYTVYYVEYWGKFIDGEMTYVYPIGFLVFFSGLFRVNYFLPKLVFLSCHVMTAYQVFRVLSRRADFGKRELFSCAFFLFNPYTCVTSIYQGLFDPVIGFLVLNLVLLLEAKKGNPFLKDVVALLLIGVITSIKFVGVVVAIPFLITRGKRVFMRRVVITVGGVFLVIAALALFDIQVSTILKPFFEQSARFMFTIYDIIQDKFGVPPPLFITAFRDFYGPIAVYVTVIALFSFDLLFFIKKFSIRLRVLLDILVFLTFFTVSNGQFVIWFMPLFILVHDEYSSTKRAMFNKMAIHQGYMGSFGFIAPFGQFLNIFFIADIYKKEIAAKASASSIVAPVVERATR